MRLRSRSAPTGATVSWEPPRACRRGTGWSRPAGNWIALACAWKTPIRIPTRAAATWPGRRAASWWTPTPSNTSSEEGEDALHRQGVPDDVAGVAGEARPVRPELELHRDARHDADCEVDAEDPDPEARGLVPALPAASQAPRLHHDDQKRLPHRQDGEEIVVDQGEGELETVEKKGVTHEVPRARPRRGDAR